MDGSLYTTLMVKYRCIIHSIMLDGKSAALDYSVSMGYSMTQELYNIYTDLLNGWRLGLDPNRSPVLYKPKCSVWRVRGLLYTYGLYLEDDDG